jgi:DNA-binding XRE family transcriptional regulator
MRSHQQALALLAEAREAAATGSGAKLRQAARLSRAELGRAAQIDEASVWRYEAGKRVPRGESAIRYAKALRRLAEIVEARAA